MAKKIFNSKPLLKLVLFYVDLILLSGCVNCANVPVLQMREAEFSSASALDEARLALEREKERTRQLETSVSR